MVKHLLSVGLLFVAAGLVFPAETPDPSRPIERRFLAPCCWRESIAFHRSTEAEAMRAEIRELVQSGKTENEIVEIFVARYGERILREPRGKLLLWLTIVPLLAILAGSLWVAAYLLRARRQIPEVTPAIALPPLPDMDENWR